MKGRRSPSAEEAERTSQAPWWGSLGRDTFRGAVRKLLGAFALMCLLYGCSGAGYLPYAPHALDPNAIHSLVTGASQENGVPEALIHAVLMAESSGDPSAVSVAGAQGLMQLMPGTSSTCGIANPFDPTENVQCGSAYLKQLMSRYKGNVTLAVAAYNAGPGAVDRYHGVPPYPETRAYVARVIAAYRSY
jgi:soluble lytic murein transglycosylase-like protein